MSDVESKILQRWRQATPENDEDFAQVVHLWRIGVPPLPPGEAPSRPELQPILTEAETRRAEVSPIRRGILARCRHWLTPSAAAAALVVLGFGLAKLGLEPSEVGGLGAAEFTTGSNETVSVTLNDGSFVRLAPDSRLRVIDTSRDRREVWLEGRGFFAIASHATRPFYVTTRAGVTQVLGTRFEVRVEEGGMRVAVVEGRVLLQAGGERVEVAGGEVSHVKDGSRPSVVKVSNVHELLHWPGGLLAFQATPLSQVVVELEAHFGIEFDIADPSVAERRVTAWFGVESFDEVVTTICRVVDAQCAFDGERVTVED